MSTSAAAQLKRIGEKAVTRSEKLVAAYALEAYRRVVEKTPVWSGEGHVGGTARRNWRVEDQDGRTLIVNETPYIEILEFGGFPNPPVKGTGRTIGGYSTQAPQGMVRVTAQEMKPVADQIVRELEARG